MKYVLLIYADENAQSGAPEDVLKAMYAAYGDFSRSLRDAGKMGPAEELAPSATAKSVRIRDGQRLVTDGPFAEVREQLGGFYVIDAADIDEAIEWAARIPSAPYGTIEVRALTEGQYPEQG
jgi:hypothetical protein